MPMSGRLLEPGKWMLAVRLHDENRNAHFFPALEFEVLADGHVVAYEASEAMPRRS